MIDADFFCLQETKMQAGQGEIDFLGWQSYWNYAEKKGYSGTAIYTKHTPLDVTYGIGIPEHDTEGRVITLEMPEFYLVCCYTPNSQDGLRRLDYRMKARERNVGWWRIDYFIVSDNLKPAVKEASIHSEIFGSDHCPVELILDI